MRFVAIISLVLILLLVALSSYLRLEHSGIGCSPWPDCYGNIGAAVEVAETSNVYERLLAEAAQPMSWARPLHRLVAAVLGMLVLGLAIMSVNYREHRRESFALLGLTVFLAWLGIYSEGLHSPAIVMGNLGGGFAMLCVCGWLVFGSESRSEGVAGSLKTWSLVALVVLSMQILVGGLTSANFAASACMTLPDCHGAWLPGNALWTAFDLSRSVATTADGFVIGGPERTAIHILHRLISLLTFTTVAVVGYLAIRAGSRLLIPGVFICVVVLLQMTTGISAVRFDIPISIAVSHNWLAALLLLGLLRIRAIGRANVSARSDGA
jgi:cytochrome c oxidase assembly protein subunit 15